MHNERTCVLRSPYFRQVHTSKYTSTYLAYLVLRNGQRAWLGAGSQVVWEMWRCEGGVSVAYPSVPFLLGAFVLIVVPSGCWPSLRGGIRSFILSKPRASSKLRIFLVGEKPWIAKEQRRNKRRKKNIRGWKAFNNPYFKAKNCCKSHLKSFLFF